MFGLVSLPNSHSPPLMQTTNNIFSIRIHIGLAASLQERVLAQWKMREENEERQRRSAISPSLNRRTPITNHIVQSSKSENISSTRKFVDHHSSVDLCDARVSSNPLKRTSPIIQQQQQQQHPRPSKIAHYDIHESLLTGEILNSGRQSSTMELMSPEINSITSDDRNHLMRQHRNDDGNY